MKLLLSSLVLGLAWFAAVNVAASGVAWISARRSLARQRLGPGRLLALRLLPSGAAATAALMLFLPGHLWFEPPDVDEKFGLVLISLALTGAALCGRSLARLVTVARASLSLGRWDGRTIRCTANPSQDVVEVAELAGVSLAGVFRTRILVGSRVRATLTAGELDVALAHEMAHRASRDNLKRCAMFCAPDLFGFSRAAADLEARWRAEAECRADAIAAGGDGHRAMLLASALLKVARLGPPLRDGHSPVWSTFHDAPLIAARVRRLAGPDAPVYHDELGFVAPILPLLSVLVWLGDGFYRIHGLTEYLVTRLP